MMKSKDYIKHLETSVNAMKKNGTREISIIATTSYFVSMVKTLKQDLERLELLEIENKVLQEELDNKNKKLGLLTNKNYQLEKENQELKKPKIDLSLLDNAKKIEVYYNEKLLEKIKDLEADVDGWKMVAENYDKHLKNYRKENQELKKAIEILKFYFNFNFNDKNLGLQIISKISCVGKGTSNCIQAVENYSILKEVLGEWMKWLRMF